MSENSDQTTSSKKKEKTVRKVRLLAGKVGGSWLESVYWHGIPAYLAVKNNELSMHRPIFMDSAEDDVWYMPVEEKQIPYRCYNFLGEEWLQPIFLESLYNEVYREFSYFVDVEDQKYLHLFTTCVLLTYVQDKTKTVPYLFLVGDRESGKTRTLEIMSHLAYRPLFGVAVPPADIYGYLEHDTAAGCILEDEIQGVEKDPDKLKIYRSGYRFGAKVPRTIIPARGRRYIHYYNTYCFKALAGERTSYDLPFMDRCILIHMVQGFPQREEIADEDLRRFSEIRNRLLVWRLKNRSNPLPKKEIILRGRARELWTPLLSLASLTPYSSPLQSLSSIHQQKRTEEIQQSLEARITEAVLIAIKEEETLELGFGDIWTHLLATISDATLDTRNPNIMHTQNFGKLSKHRVGSRLKDILKAESKVTWKDNQSVRTFLFDSQRLQRACQKYYLPQYLSDLTDLTVLTVSSGVSSVPYAIQYPNLHRELDIETDVDTSTNCKVCKDGKDYGWVPPELTKKLKENSKRI